MSLDVSLRQGVKKLEALERGMLKKRILVFTRVLLVLTVSEISRKAYKWRT